MPGYVFSCFDLAQRTPIIAIAQVVGILGSWGPRTRPCNLFR